jgi:serine protease Do
MPFEGNEIMRHLALILLAIAALALGRIAGAETIVLRDRKTLTAPILKQTVDHIYVDLGFDVLRIPRSAVQEITDQPPAPSTPSPEIPAAGGLYATGDPRLGSTVEGVKAFGAAVVVVKSPAGLGSGFIVHADGYLITNFHVIEGQKHLTVTQFVPRGPELIHRVHEKVRIVAIDAFHDLAVLQIQDPTAGPFPTVVLGAGEPQYGEQVFVMGNPLGLERTVTEGILSHTGRLFAGSLYLQIDASVNPGNSGGPLFNGRGQVIGVVNMGVPVMQGLNFAIPVRHVAFLLDHIEAYAYDASNSESGFVYVAAPPNPQKQQADAKDD